MVASIARGASASRRESAEPSSTWVEPHAGAKRNPRARQGPGRRELGRSARTQVPKSTQGVRSWSHSAPGAGVSCEIR